MSTSTLAPALPDPAQVEREVRMMLARTPDNKVTREVIEAALWRFTGWRGNTDMIEAFLRLVDAYAKQPTPARYAPAPPADWDLAQNQQKAILTTPRTSEYPVTFNVTAQEALDDVKAEAKEAMVQAGAGKNCNACGEFKSWDSFTTDNARKDRKRGKCKDCEREAKRLKRMEPAS